MPSDPPGLGVPSQAGRGSTRHRCRRAGRDCRPLAAVVCSGASRLAEPASYQDPAEATKHDPCLGVLPNDKLGKYTNGRLVYCSTGTATPGKPGMSWY